MPMSCVHDTVCEWRLQPPRVAAGSDRGTGPFAPAAESTPGALFDAPAGAACAGERVQPARAWHARRGAEARRTCALTICCRCAAICAAAIAASCAGVIAMALGVGVGNPTPPTSPTFS